VRNASRVVSTVAACVEAAAEQSRANGRANGLAEQARRAHHKLPAYMATRWSYTDNPVLKVYFDGVESTLLECVEAAAEQSGQARANGGLSVQARRALHGLPSSMATGWSYTDDPTDNPVLKVYFDGVVSTLLECVEAAAEQSRQAGRQAGGLRKRAGSSSEHHGVNWVEKRGWRARLLTGRRPTVGHYSSEDAAARAHDWAAVTLHSRTSGTEEYTGNLNFPGEAIIEPEHHYQL
jgi:hypothetical protein